MQNGESKWTLIANGKSIANGKTIRKNGVVSHFVTSPIDDEYKKQPKPQKQELAEKQNEADDSDLEDGEGCFCSEEAAKERKCLSLKVNTSATKSSHGALTTVIQQLKWRECKGHFKQATNNKIKKKQGPQACLHPEQPNRNFHNHDLFLLEEEGQYLCRKEGSYPSDPCQYAANGSPADMYWHGPGFEESLYNKGGVYAVNKLPGIVELSQKIHLSRIIKRMQLLFPGEFDFYPQTWFLPEQYHQFVAEVSLKTKRKSHLLSTSSNHSSKTQSLNRLTPEPKSPKESLPTFIVKPDCGSQGDGIYLVNDPRDVHGVVGSKAAIVQKYVDNPLLLDNFKFDLRMYVAVARLNPIEIYLCKDGLARLCTVEYESPRPSNIHNSFMHLTNYSLNKFSEDFQQTSAEHTGSKRTYRAVRQILRKQGYDVDRIHRQIVDLVVKTVLSLIPDIMIWDHVTNRTRLVRSFQILGFDILITSDLKAHLLEVNSSPSMGIDADQETEPGSGILENVTSVVDEQIKVPLLRDVLRLIAYGEGKINMAKSCLQRVYPPVSKVANHVTPRQEPSPNEKLSTPRVRLPHFKENVPLSTEATDHSSGENSRFQTRVLNMNDKPHFGEGIRSKIKVSDLHETDIRMVERYGVNSQSDFDNPLLRNEMTSRQHYQAKRPKRFTVVKYRQEYAISTEEWRLFQLRSRLSSTLASSRTQSQPLRTLQPRPSPRRTTIAQEYLETPRSNVKAIDSQHNSACCKICGHYIDGVGPGLLKAQQEYKVTLEQNEAKLAKERAVFQPLSASSFTTPRNDCYDRFNESPNHISDEWESEPRFPQVNPMPPRSIYFSSAQYEEDGFYSQRSNVPPFSPGFAMEESTPRMVKEICDNCMETSTSSSMEDSTPSRKDTSASRVANARKSKPLLKVAQVQPGPPEKSKTFAIKDVMLIRRAAAIFIFFNGIKPSLRIGATAFRNMARRCRLCDQGSMPAIDILFIDTMRQWQRQAIEHSTPFYDTYRSKNPMTSQLTTIGLPFQGFLEALFRIAKARFKGSSLKEKMETLVLSCEQYIKEANRADKIAKKRKDMQTQNKPKVAMSPRISCGMSQRQPYY